MKYRKKPIVIDAVQFEGRDHDEVHFSDYPDWFVRAMNNDYLRLEPAVMNFQPERVRMTTIHGDSAWAKAGDWIVPEIQPGRFYPIDAEVFIATYEPVKENS